MPAFLKLKPPADGMALHRSFGKPVTLGGIAGLVALGRHTAEERPGRGTRRCGGIGRPLPARLFRPDSAATGIPGSSGTPGMPGIIGIISAPSPALGKDDTAAVDEVALPMPIAQKRPGPLHVPT